MRVLHVGYGFRPWIVNGLVIYIGAVTQGQVRQGHEVAYFFPARRLPFTHRPLVHRWHRNGVHMYELMNSSLIVGRHRGTPRPSDDLEHAFSEAAFVRVLDRFRPELIHFHDLGGLPSSLLDLARDHGVPAVMTIHDYHPLCPTVKLYDAHDRICMRPDPGPMCAVCCAHAPDDNADELARTLKYTRRRLRRAVPQLDPVFRGSVGRRFNDPLSRVMDRAAGLRPAEPASAAPGPKALGRAPRAPADAYQRRRDVNVERLGKLEALIASSARSAEIYRQLGVAPARIEIVPINPPHIEQLQARAPRAPAEPLRFVALNACNSTEKGADLIVAALDELSGRGLGARFRLSVVGPVAQHVEPTLAARPEVDLYGRYEISELNEILDEADVGLFPSVWEEVYGFAALELLAKGIPVIGNAIGAIPEYVRPGETGWLNHSASASELAALMAQAIENPDEVRRISESVVARRDELIRPFSEGLERLTAIYRDVLARNGRG
jgi:glycosyltransferase involved in cell wall biosynthesis